MKGISSVFLSVHLVGLTLNEEWSEKFISIRISQLSHHGFPDVEYESLLVWFFIFLSTSGSITQMVLIAERLSCLPKSSSRYA